MKREEIKSYEDACKVIGRKPRTYKDKHLNLYEQLSTIIAALNFISNDNKSWTPKFGCIEKMDIIKLRLCSICILTVGWAIPMVLSGLL